MTGPRSGGPVVLPGDVFRAALPFGPAGLRDTLRATFVVAAVLPCGAVRCEGRVDPLTAQGRPYAGPDARAATFDWRGGVLVQRHPIQGRGWRALFMGVGP